MLAHRVLGGPPIGRLLLVGLQLLCSIELVRPATDVCKVADESLVLYKYKDFCCGNESPEDSQPEPKPVPVPYEPPQKGSGRLTRELRATEKDIECLLKFGRALKSFKPRFPMDCCRTRVFDDICAKTNNNERRLNSLMAQSKVVMDSGDGELKGTCGQGIKQQCCSPSRGGLSRALGRPEPKDMLFIPIITNIAQCTIGLLTNILSGRFQLPDVCCQVPIFGLLCGNRSSTMSPRRKLSPDKKPSSTKQPTSSAPKTSKPTTGKASPSPKAKPEKTQPKSTLKPKPKPKGTPSQKANPKKTPSSKPAPSKTPSSKPAPSKGSSSKPKSSKASSSKPKSSKAPSSKPNPSKTPKPQKGKSTKTSSSKPAPGKTSSSKPAPGKTSTSKPKASKTSSSKPKTSKAPSAKPSPKMTPSPSPKPKSTKTSPGSPSTAPQTSTKSPSPSTTKSASAPKSTPKPV